MQLLQILGMRLIKQQQQKNGKVPRDQQERQAITTLQLSGGK